MYYQNYEDYMRDVLGYSNTYYNQMPSTYYENYLEQQNREVERLYPELYHSIYPIICRVCNKNTKPLNAENLEELTAEVFVQLESEGNDNIGGNVKVQVRNNTSIGNTRIKEEPTRQRNPILQDLVKILILRELLGKPEIRPRPPKPPRPPMPPLHSCPPYPGPGHYFHNY